MPEALDASPADVGALTARVLRLRAGGGPDRAGRALVGIAGAPGAGKSTLVPVLARELAGHGLTCAVVGMDGFHLAHAELERLGRAARKGAPDTFDAHGYVALVRRVRVQRPGSPTVYAPVFDRRLEEPVAGAVAVVADVDVVLTEGNYLLLPDEPWSRLPRLLDETWFLEAGDQARRARLLARHLAHGKDEDAARAFAHGSDQANAELVAATRARADVVVRWHDA